MSGREAPERPQSRLIWVDMEMSGLDPRVETILEIATVVTDSQLEVLARGPSLVIHQPDSVLEAMNEWCVQTHASSGLTEAVRASTISLAEAEEQTLAFLREHCAPGECPLCGNSIGLDWSFINAYMPRLDAFLGPQLLDVTAVKELARRWYPGAEPPDKAGGHRALDDILESIEELRYYRGAIFRPADPQPGASHDPGQG